MGAAVQQPGIRLTEGGVVRSLLRFALPLLMVGVVQSLYGIMDLAILGLYCGNAAVSAVGIGSNLLHLFNKATAGIFLGGTIQIAYAVGAGDAMRARRAVGALSLLFPALGALASGAILVFMDAFLALYRTPHACVADARAYLWITASFLWLDIGYTYLSAVLRGHGDSRHPMQFISVACLSNIALDFVFVGALRMGVRGAAIGTVVAQALGLVLMYQYMRRHGYTLRPNMDRAMLRAIFGTGLPVSAQDTVAELSFLLIQALINSYGVAAAAAISINNKCMSFAMLPASAFYSAIAAVCSQNFGAGQYRRAEKTLVSGIALAVLMSLPLFLLCQLSPDKVGGFFSATGETLLRSREYMRTVSFDYVLVCFSFCMCGYLNASGRSRLVMLYCVLTTALLRVPFAYFFRTLWPTTLSGIGLAAPATSVVLIAICVITLLRNRLPVGARIGAHARD